MGLPGLDWSTWMGATGDGLWKRYSQRDERAGIHRKEEDMLEHSPEINEIAAALAAAQSKFDKVVKDTDNPFFKSKYATLAAIIEATRKGLTENGIATVQDVNF